MDEPKEAKSRLSTDEAMVTSQKWHGAFYAMYLFVMFVGPLVMYSRSVYPQISSAFSGGRTQSVVLIIKSEQVDAAKAGGLVLSDDRKTSLEIIFDAPEFFLVNPPTESINTPKVKAIRTRKDLVDTVLYLDRVAR